MYPKLAPINVSRSLALAAGRAARQGRVENEAYGRRFMASFAAVGRLC
jgi:hypothetical protein